MTRTFHNFVAMWRGVYGSHKNCFRGVMGTKSDRSVFRQREKRNRTQLDKLLKDFLVNGAEKWVVGGGCKVSFSIFYLN